MIIDKEAVIFQMVDKPVTLEIGFVFALETKYLESLKEVRVQQCAASLKKFQDMYLGLHQSYYS